VLQCIWQCVAVRYSISKRVAMCCSVLQCVADPHVRVALHCDSCNVFPCVFQCATVFYSVLQCVEKSARCISLCHTATHCNTLQHTVTHCNTPQHCNTLHHTTTHALHLTLCVAGCYSVLQRVAARCSVFQCDTVCCKFASTRCTS